MSVNGSRNRVLTKTPVYERTLRPQRDFVLRETEAWQSKPAAGEGWTEVRAQTPAQRNLALMTQLWPPGVRYALRTKPVRVSGTNRSGFPVPAPWHRITLSLSKTQRERVSCASPPPLSGA